MAFPVSGTPNGGNEPANTASHVINMPAGVVAGDRVTVLTVVDGALPLTGWPSGWISLAALAIPSDGMYALRYKDCDGTEPASFTLAVGAPTQMSQHTTDRIQAGTFDPAVPPQVSTPATGTASTTIAPPPLTPSWGAADTGWRVCLGWDAGNLTLVGSIATYTLLRTDSTGTSQGGGVSMWRKDNNIATETPGTIGLSGSGRWVAVTMAHKPAAAAGSANGAFNLALAPVTLVAAGTVASPPTTCVSSTFDGTESPLAENPGSGPVWTNALVGGFEKVVGFARPQINNNHSYAAYTGRTWSADQSSKVTRGAASVLSGTRVSAGVRLSNLGTSNPFGYIFSASEFVNYVLIRVEAGGSHTTLQTYAIAPTVTDVFKLTVVGTTLTPEVNGVPLAPVTDATYASGSPGVHCLMVTTNDVIDAWEGCDVGAAPPPATGTLAKALDPVTLAAIGTVTGAPPAEIFPLWGIDARATWRREVRVRVFIGDVVPVTAAPTGPQGAAAPLLGPLTMVATGVQSPPTGAFAQVLDPVTLAAAGNTGAAPAGAVIGIDMSGGLTAGMQRGLY